MTTRRYTNDEEDDEDELLSPAIRASNENIESQLDEEMRRIAEEEAAVDAAYEDDDPEQRAAEEAAVDAAYAAHEEPSDETRSTSTRSAPVKARPPKVRGFYRPTEDATDDSPLAEVARARVVRQAPAPVEAAVATRATPDFDAMEARALESQEGARTRARIIGAIAAMFGGGPELSQRLLDNASAAPELERIEMRRRRAAEATEASRRAEAEAAAMAERAAAGKETARQRAAQESRATRDEARDERRLAMQERAAEGLAAQRAVQTETGALRSEAADPGSELSREAQATALEALPRIAELMPESAATINEQQIRAMSYDQLRSHPLLQGFVRAQASRFARRGTGAARSAGGGGGAPGPGNDVLVNAYLDLHPDATEEEARQFVGSMSEQSRQVVLRGRFGGNLAIEREERREGRERERETELLPGIAGSVRMNPTEQRTLREASGELVVGGAALNQVDAIAREYGPSAVINPEAWARLDAPRAALVSMVANIKNIGVVQQGEMPSVLAALPSPDQARGWTFNRLQASLNAWREQAESVIVAKLLVRGVPAEDARRFFRESMRTVGASPTGRGSSTGRTSGALPSAPDTETRSRGEAEVMRLRDRQTGRVVSARVGRATAERIRAGSHDRYEAAP